MLFPGLKGERAYLDNRPYGGAICAATEPEHDCQTSFAWWIWSNNALPELWWCFESGSAGRSE